MEWGGGPPGPERNGTTIQDRLQLGCRSLRRRPNGASTDAFHCAAGLTRTLWRGMAISLTEEQTLKWEKRQRRPGFCLAPGIHFSHNPSKCKRPAAAGFNRRRERKAVNPGRGRTRRSRTEGERQRLCGGVGTGHEPGGSPNTRGCLERRWDERQRGGSLADGLPDCGESAGRLWGKGLSLLRQTGPSALWGLPLQRPFITPVAAAL